MEKVITTARELADLLCPSNIEGGNAEAVTLIESYVAAREAAMVERILDRFGDDEDICGLSIKGIIREAARRKE